MKKVFRRLPKRKEAINKYASEIGELIRKTRSSKEISQIQIAKATAAGKGPAYNGRISEIERGVVLPNDAELTVIARLLGLSVVSMREARERTRKARGGDMKLALTKLAAKPATKLAAHTARAPAPVASAPAPSIEFIQAVDGLIPMPTDPDLRKRWWSAVGSLFALQGAEQ